MKPPEDDPHAPPARATRWAEIVSTALHWWCAPLVVATLIVLVGYAVLALTGCSVLSCGASGTNGAAAGGCQAGTRF